MELTHRTVVRAARRAVHDLARDLGRRAARVDRAPRERRDGLRRGLAAGALRRERRVRPGVPRPRPRTLLGDDPFALEEIQARLAELPGEWRRRRRSTWRSTTSAASSPACPCGSCSACRARGRRPRGRSGSAIRTTWRGAPSASTARFRRLKLKLGGRDGLDVERVRAVRSQTDAPAHGRRERVLGARRGDRERGRARRARGRVRRAAASGRRSADGPKLKAAATLPIYVDEDCHTLADVAACAERAHGINIKLAKSRRDPRGRQDGRCGPGARARRHARLHDRVRPRHLRGRAGREPLRPRRPRREPASRARPVARRRVRRRRPAPGRRAGPRSQ